MWDIQKGCWILEKLFNIINRIKLSRTYWIIIKIINSKYGIWSIEFINSIELVTITSWGKLKKSWRCIIVTLIKILRIKRN